MILLDQLDYETTTNYELTVRASDVVTGSVADTAVHIVVEVQKLFFAVIYKAADVTSHDVPW